MPGEWVRALRAAFQRESLVLPAPPAAQPGWGFAVGQSHPGNIAFLRLKEEEAQKVEVRNLSVPLDPGHYFRENKASPTNCWGLLTSVSPGKLGCGQL